LKVLTDPRVLEELSKDSGLVQLTPKAAYVAETEADVTEVMSAASERGDSVTPRGGGTSIPSQSVGTGVILLQAPRRIVLREGSVACGPSVVKADLNRELDAHLVWLPPDPSSYQTCTVGGMVSNNSSGTRTFKYGSTMDYVRELEVVLPEEGPKKLMPMKMDEALHADATTRKVAELIVENAKLIEEEKPPVRKNSSGYRLEKVIHDGVFDLSKLFVGSEGTLGVITRVVFATPAKPRSRALLVVETSLAELDRVVTLFRRLLPSAVELVDKSVFKQTGKEERLRALSRTDEKYMVFCELDGGNADDVSRLLEIASGSEIAGFEPLTMTDPGGIAAAWEVRNETLTLAAEIKDGSKIFVPGVEDLVVPPERLGALVALLVDEFESKGLPYISYGHAADANLHMRPMLDPNSSAGRSTLDEIMEDCFGAVWKMKGSMSGEHGDGMLRARFVRRQYPKTYGLMKQIRETYDPKGLLNPGVKIV
jgi:FAD/FMN-containing dehydrogenase